MSATKKRTVGRPRLPEGQAKDVKIIIRLTPAFYKALCAAAKRSGSNLTGYVRGAIEDRLSKEQ